MRDMAVAGQGEWISLERGPTQNAGYVIGGAFLVIMLFALIGRGFTDLPFDRALFVGTAKFLGLMGLFTSVVTIFLKSWKIRYNRLEIVTKRYATLSGKEIFYRFADLRGVSCYFSRAVMPFGLPFDTIVVSFADDKLELRTRDWKRESLKQFVRDVTSYRNDLPCDPQLQDYVDGSYDDIFRN